MSEPVTLILVGYLLVLVCVCGTAWALAINAARMDRDAERHSDDR